MVAAAATGEPASILDLGISSELTAQRVLEALPEARLLGVDASPEMLAAAETTLDPADVITPINWVDDTPSSLDEQLTWLAEAGLTTRVHWQHRDLAVIVAQKD